MSLADNDKCIDNPTGQSKESQMDIWCALKSSWPAIESFLKIAPGLVLLPLTLFLGWKKIGHKVQVSFGWSHNRITAKHISDVVISNLKDKPLTVHEIHLLIDRDIVVPVAKLKPPVIVKGLESIVVEPKPVSAYYIGDQEYEPGQTQNGLVEMFITTPDGLVKCEIVSDPSIRSFKKLRDYRSAQTSTSSYNGIVYNDKALYALVYIYDGGTKTAIVEKSGFITVGWPFLPNALQQDDLASEQTVKAALMSSEISHVIKESELYVHKLD